MRSIFILLMVFSLMFAACKSDNTSGKGSSASPAPISDAYILSNQMGIAPIEIEAMRKAASETLAFRKKESGNKSYTIMDKDIWAFGGFVTESKTLFTDSLGGAWIDFKENLTYDYGKFDQKGGSGHYFYDMEKATLLMLDDNPAIKAQEFEVKLRDDMLVIVGLFNTKDNNIQAKLDRMPAYPSKVKPTAAPL
ncbi:MAG: hypothetical protein WAT22_09660 [Saprospiraceae bacterium]|jgi:hypothetical protein|nr:hypothetical protein [Saprospiraceae bacterium]